MNAKEIFLEAIAIDDPELRRAFLNKVCQQDLSLRARVDALLAAHDDPDSYLERPAANFDVSATIDSANGLELSDSSSHHGRFVPGTKIAGRYRIVSLLGRGGMGEVYRADDLRLGTAVALKFLPAELAKDNKRLDYFHNEVRMARQISHPNVCRVYDIGDADGQQFISMEYIDGEDLKSLLHRIGRLPNDKGVQIAQQLCSGLAAAHAKGVLHRDLKPANVMLDGHGQVRITDFGLATAAIDGESVVGMSGTPAYMAPEQLLRGETSVQSDIYSLGLILFEVFTGKPTYTATSLDELRSLHANSSRPADPSDVVENLDSVVCRAVSRCLTPEPHRRPRSATEVAASLPGGDPLAAVLAAGETPSPELVAAAGSHETLSHRTAWFCVAAVVIGLIAAAFVASRAHVINRLDHVLEPGVLRYRAREILDHLGYDFTSRPSGVAYGFDDVDSRFHELSKHRDKSSSIPIPRLGFWYREAERPFNSERMVYHLNGQGPAYVGQSYPEWTQSGMRGVKLDVSGHLIWFRAVTHPNTLPPTASPNWAAWFPPDVVGFDLEEFSPIDDGDLPPGTWDVTQAWKRHVSNEGTLRISAAAYRGRPVYFHVEPALGTSRSQVKQPKNSHASRVAIGALSTGITIALFFFFRNIYLGRWDRRGALRLAVFLTATGFVGNILRAHHSSGLWERAILQLCLGGAFVVAAEVSVYYVAIEPLVRRWRPKLLISWSRLLDGRFTDPLVAADVLFGTAIGVFSGIFFELPFALTDSGLSREVNPYFLSGYASEFGSMIIGLFFDTAITLFLTFGLVVGRALFRSQLIASAGLVLLLSYIEVQAAGLGFTLGMPIVLGEILLMFALVRFGLVAAISGSLVLGLVRFPISLDPSDFWFGYGLFAIALVLAIAGYGFLVSTATGRTTRFRV